MNAKTVLLAYYEAQSRLTLPRDHPTRHTWQHTLRTLGRLETRLERICEEYDHRRAITRNTAQ